ncbi:MAG: hypothetical protein M1142_00695 [Patescibacteria group bacterium]|nr:hypothetical protein [Patescibacteria group bacterium]
MDDNQTTQPTPVADPTAVDPNAPVMPAAEPTTEVPAFNPEPMATGETPAVPTAEVPGDNQVPVAETTEAGEENAAQ